MSTVAAPHRPKAKQWYRIENRADGAASVFLYDEIGAWGVGAGDFVKELRDCAASSIDLHINSPGGDVFDGMAIYNAIKAHPSTVNVTVDGIAASAASFVAMAGDRIAMARNAQLMIHDAHAVAVGNAKDMTAMVDLLDRCSTNIADIYAQRAGGTSAQWRERMRTETWYSAEEAVAAGLADEVAPAPAARVRNTWDLSIFNYAGREHAPDPLADPVEPEPAPEPDPPTVEEAEEPEAPEPVRQPDEWAAIAAKLLTPTSTVDEEFARLRRALL